MGTMDGRICLVTGATSGIGRVAALALARLGATVVITARDRERGEATAAALRAESGNPAVDLLLVDFASQRAIRAAAAEFRRKYDRLHVLLNNHGGIFGSRVVTKDGLELTFAVNHLGYFLLTNLLLDCLKVGAPARIINVSSAAHTRGSLNFDDLQLEKGYNEAVAYANSKLANILFTDELARRLAGTGVTANAVHPGGVRTRWGDTGSGLFRFAIRLARPFLISAEAGAETLVYLAADPVVSGQTGQYWYKKAIRRKAPRAQDAAAAARLWQVSAVLTGLPAEPAPP